MATKPVARVAPWKRQEVENLTAALKDTPVVALARIDKLPSKQFQQVRASVREHATIRVVKNTLLELALDNLEGDKDSITDLEDHLEGQTALILTDANPFKLFNLIESSKAKAPAKAGDTAPADIKVEKGDTPFKPGPVVGDLQKAGLPAKIESGKVVIASTKVVVEKGEEISADLANALTRLEIHPMTVGLDVQAVWEDGTVFGREALDIDPDAFLADLKTAHARALSLALEVGHPTSKTMPLLLAKAAQQAHNLAVESAYPAEGVIDVLLAKAHAQASSLAEHLPEQAPSGASEAPEPSEEEEDEDEAGSPEASDENDGTDEASEEDADGSEASEEEAKDAGETSD